MTTKLLDNKICTFKSLLSWRFPKKKNWTSCLSAPNAPPFKNVCFYFIVVSPSLTNQAACNLYEEALCCALLRPFSALLRSFVDSRLRSFASFCVQPRFEQPLLGIKFCFRYLLCPTAPRVAAMKKLCLVHCGKCRGFFVKCFAANFPGNRRTKICEKFAKISRHFSPISCKIFGRTSLWGIAGTIVCDALTRYFFVALSCLFVANFFRSPISSMENSVCACLGGFCSWLFRGPQFKGPFRTVFCTEGFFVVFYYSVVNLLRILIHYSKHSKPVHKM